ncbi:MAG: hypothetical protein GX096_10045 [Clostridiales bacterium]|nr:hypothetical protein [Clostridiales bacterium]
MICLHCGRSVPDDALTCDGCGTFLGKYSGSAYSETGVRAIRQGRVSASQETIPSQNKGSREYGDYGLSPLPVDAQAVKPRRAPAGKVTPAKKTGASKPHSSRGVPVNAYGRAPTVTRRKSHSRTKRRGHFNWMRFGVILTILSIVVAGSYFVYVKNSDAGQRQTARTNVLSTNETMLALAANAKDVLVQTEREALLKEWNQPSPQSYWLVGQDYLDVGDLQNAILSFRIADILDPENYDGLILLANAYELSDENDKAEEQYLHLANTVSTFRSEAYTALIRMYQEQERGPEAADMMLLAYNNTDKETFRLQRKDYIPLTPQINLKAGRYQINKIAETISLTSPQGYDIYYTTDDEALLPQEGILAEDGRIVPVEGAINIRAVCVSGDLVSDPMKVSYTFFFVSPPAPKCNLAPGTYKSLRQITLRAGDLEDVAKKELAEMEENYVYYYTIDGSTPTEDSPIYDGTPIVMPAGSVTLKAICVNEFGKMSAVMEYGYKFNVKPGLLTVYEESDTFSSFTLSKTTMDEFKQTFGSPTSELETTYLQSTAQAQHLTYPWGYAVFLKISNEWQLYRIEMTSSIATAPRGLSFTSTESGITGAFKDFGQPESKSGNRGLYYKHPTIGQVVVQEDGSRIVRYQCNTAISKMWYLEFYLSGDQVQKIVHYSMP